jgi:murein L,D-transpeptidase YafK
LGRAAVALLLLAGGLSPVCALEIVLKDVASDRVERQRHFVRRELPLPGTPDLTKLDERLSAQGLTKGRAIYVRIFKAESELELWMQNGTGTFTQLAVYPICHWTGTIGPKLKEGDKQSPEGFYSVGVRQTRLVGRWRRAFNVGFPNLHDQRLNRTGSYILIHGGCSSTGCFAMTDPVQEEIYELAKAALAGGQERFQVHIFPFRMTEANLARHADHDWAHTWADLKPAYDSFERTRIPPRVVLCGVRYKVADGLPGETGGTEARLPVLKPPAGERLPTDPTLVVDADGKWKEPACRLDDEDKRRATYAAADMTTSTIPSAVAEPAPAPEPSTLSLATSSSVAESTPRGRSLARPHHHQPPPKAAARRSSGPDDGRVAVPVGDGFGSATFRAKGNEKVSAHGG